MKAAIYCRVSTEGQEREGTSLQSQLDACLVKSRELGYETPSEFTISETYSGLSLDRPKLNQLREWVRNKEVDAVIAYTLDRLSRDPVHFIILQEELEHNGIGLVLVTEDLDNSDLGLLITHIKGYAAKLEAEKIKERTMRGKRERVKSGKLPGGSNSNLFGYKYVCGKGIGEGIRYPNKGETEWVRQIFKWYTEESLSIRKVAHRLTSLGVRTPSGQQGWASATIYGILKQPAYMGQDLQSSNSTPAIISRELFDNTQLMLQRRKQLSPRRTKRQYLLRGHITCAQCGRHYIGQANVTDSKIHKYYSCLRAYHADKPPRCHNRNWRVDELDAIVWAEVERVLSNPEVVFAEIQRRAEEGEEDILGKELERIRHLIKNREAQKERIYRAFYLTGNEDTFKQDIATIEQEVQRLETEVGNLEHHIELSREYQFDVSRLKEACALVARNAGNLSFEEKRLALQALDVSVIVDKDKVTLCGALPAEGLLSVSGQPRLTI